MTKFYQYINEENKWYPDESDVADAWDVLLKDCSEIIDFYKKSKVVNDEDALYRGIRKNIGILSDKIHPRKNRVPKDMPPAIHKKLDEAFKDKFGWAARSQGVFSYGRYSDAHRYGTPYVVFPANGFKYLWSPEVKDLYVNFRANFQDTNIDDEIDLIVDTYKDEDLEQAIYIGNEIIINCKYYYMINRDTWELLLLDYIKE